MGYLSLELSNTNDGQNFVGIDIMTTEPEQLGEHSE